MKITKISVGAELHFKLDDGTNSFPDVRVEAALEPGDDPQECARELRLQAESMLAQHVTEIKNAHEVRTRLKSANEPGIAAPPKRDYSALDMFPFPRAPTAPGDTAAEVRLKDMLMQNAMTNVAPPVLAVDRSVWNNITLHCDDPTEEQKEKLTYPKLREYVSKILGK